MILATFVFVIILFLVFALFSLIEGGSNSEGPKNNEFLKGALIGLIGTGLTALTALGNNILEKDSKDSEKPKCKNSKSDAQQQGRPQADQDGNS